jgi:hypothetical protein
MTGGGYEVGIPGQALAVSIPRGRIGDGQPYGERVVLLAETGAGEKPAVPHRARRPRRWHPCAHRMHRTSAGLGPAGGDGVSMNPRRTVKTATLVSL